MTCSIVRENLVAWLHGELDKKIVMAIHQHLGQCEACVQEEMELRQTSRLLDRWPYAELPADFDEKLQRKIQQATPVGRILSSSLRRMAVAVAATVLIVLGLQFVGLKLLSTGRSSIRLNDFPTSQAVFKAPAAQPAMDQSLRERLLLRHKAAAESGRLRFERVD